MSWSFNPFTGNLDLTGSSGAVVFEGEVETFADLPEVVGDPPVGSSYLVRTSTGVWLVNRKQAGIWIRSNNTGVRDTDWAYGGDYPVNSVAGKTGNVSLNKSDVGLGNVDNTSDANKPISAATQTALDGKAASVHTHTASQISDSTSTGRSVLTAADAAAARSAISAQVAGSYAAASHAHAASDVTSGTFDNARINFAAPSAIGSTTASSGAFTTLSANNGTITASAPVLDLSQTWNNAAVTFTGLRFNVTNTASAAASPLIDLQVGGVSRMRMTRGGTLHLSEHSNSGLYSPAPVWTGSTAGLLAAANLAVGSSLDTILERGGAGILEQRNGVNAQTFRLYNTFTDASNYERGFMRWSSNVLQIGTEKGGTGSARNLELLTDNTWRARLQSEGLLLNTSGPRVYFGNPLISGDAESNVSLDLQPFGAGNVIIRSGLLKMNGTTSSFPALKRSSTALQVRLADDSAFAPLSCGALTLNGNLDASTRDIVTDTTTGTKIGTGTTQKLGFFNATPVIQQAAVADATDAATVITQLNALLSRMRTLGLIAT